MMMTSKYLLIFLLASFAAAGPAANQALAQAEAPPEISLSDAIEIALARNLNVQRAATQVDLGQINVGQRRAEFLPNLNLSLSPSVRYGQSFDQTTARLGSEQTTSLSVGASSSLNLFNGFADIAALREAQLARDATSMSLEQTEASTVYQTAAQYLQVFLTEELINVVEANLDAQRAQLERIEAFYEAGNISYSDVLQQRAAIALSEQRVIAAERNHETAKLRLKQTLNLDPQLEVVFQPVSDGALRALASGVEASADQFIRHAIAQRPDIQAQRLRIDASDESLRGARAGYYPSVSLSMSTSTSYSSRSDAFSFMDQLTDVNPSGGLGLSLSVPIFNRQRISAAVERARVGQLNERLALESLEQEVAFEVQQALLDIRTAEAQLRTANVQRESAQEALDAAEARYSVGASTLVEVNQARSLLVEAAAQEVDALYSVVTARLNLGFQTGTMPELVEAIR